MSRYFIAGCGDVGRRIIAALIAQGFEPAHIGGTARSPESQAKAKVLGVNVFLLDLDRNESCDFSAITADTQLYYTIAPSASGDQDRRTARFLSALTDQRTLPQKIVLISTTGVYGDCEGRWVDESAPLNPMTDRAKRRVDMERQFTAFAARVEIPLITLRVPGIYARSRLPERRIRSGEPVLTIAESGFSNRVHADDLAEICVLVMQRLNQSDVFNVSDGKPGTITEYLHTVADFLALPRLPEVSAAQAQIKLSSGLRSYLNESRRISNTKLLSVLNTELRYPDFRNGMKY